ncbi:threonine synthase [Ferrimonas sp. SCSIO 43195]|uniref:threonine synthase n=1 Tax=Ferrimonas sp. SCSIO 43195 TaxID=2822844 RepID=UPI0020757826|nr:threonine synthase [Ferrimonas sp. SCSIO 43195]USD38398.1 threonine synthase [Ferrimonas sp. SCSIO 43195]
MELYNLKHPQQKVSFSQAVRQGLGRDRGLFFPSQLPAFDDIDAVLEMDFVDRSVAILSAWLADELGQENVESLVRDAFTFACPLVAASDHQYCLELYHGPTLAFKDFGARFLARALSQLAGDEKLTILTATSGDTGAAVADAFFGLDNIDVVILYPQGRISPLQEKMFCTLGGNIRTVAVQGSFDDCQALVKQAFEDEQLKQAIGLNSANSINIARLLAQICYYFEAIAQLPAAKRRQAVVAVPSGNFGNLTAGLLAKSMGLPVKRFIAATNSNDTVPRYLRSGHWQVNPTVATRSNAMDVSAPNNWPRVEALCRANSWPLATIEGAAVSERECELQLQALHQQGYLSEPHAAIASRALSCSLKGDEVGVFLGTAHPAKFKESVDELLELDLPLPQALAEAAVKPLLSDAMEADYGQLRSYLLKPE